jgi:dTDP-L-rhamnose 4-epimerase
MRVLITGGAGFIGSHLADLMLSRGYDVRALDSLEEQVHGPSRQRPAYLDPRVELRVGDVRDAAAVSQALEGCDLLVHFAAAVGVGQSMYQIEKYTSMNSIGAAVVLEQAVKKAGALRKMLVASSMSIYGEGLYECPACGPVSPRLRKASQLSERAWEMRCPGCGADCRPLPTPETKPLYPTSIYAINKRDHEEMFLSVGEAYDIPAVAMRFFNVYGTRQALSNPYTGVAAIFASRLLNNKPPVVFEDGLQSRDFVHVSDIARACLLAVESDISGEVFNVGTGRPTSVLDMAAALAGRLGRPLEFEVKNQFRAGDIRHCYADVSKARDLLGFDALRAFDDGVDELVGWVRTCTASDLVDTATRELQERGLAR